jgi:hypothetical protein
MPRSAVLAAALAALLLAAPAAPAAEPVMPLSEVRAGMQCTARSVVQGTAISTFRADVVDVLTGTGPLDDTGILIRVSGPAVDATGVGQGFSGSPVSCPGADGVLRIAGAISQSLADFGGDLVLATPIEAMLGEPVEPPAGARGDALARRTLARARPLRAPLTVGGLAPPLARAVARAGRRAGTVVLAAPGAPRAAFGSEPVQPGSAIGTGRATGDLTLGELGTATYVDGDRVWAFGHSLAAAGRRALFLQSAYVFAVVGNPLGVEGAQTYKLGALGPVAGTLTGDGLHSVAGVLGAGPPAIPLRVLARDGDRGTRRAVGVLVADERAVDLPAGSHLGGVTGIAVADAATRVLGAAPRRQSGRMCARFELRGQRPLWFCNAYAYVDESGLAGLPMAGDLIRAALLVDGFDGAPLPLQSVAVDLTVRRDLRQLFLAGLRGPRAVRRGATVGIRARLRRAGGGTSWRTLRVRVPRSTGKGLRRLVVAGTPADTNGGGSDIAIEAILETLMGESSSPPRGPATLAGLRRAFRRIERFAGVRAAFQRADRPVRPARVRRTGAVVLRDPAERISGAASLRLRVR